MEEVDKHLLTQLKDFGVSIPANTTALGSLPAEVLYTALYKILGNSELPPVLPASTSQKCRACTTMATAMSAAGYPEEVAYNNILYPTPEETRSIVSWLLSKAAGMADEDEGGNQAKTTGMSKNVRRGLMALSQQRVGSQTTTLPKAKVFTTQKVIPIIPSANISQEEIQYVQAQVPVVTAQQKSRYALQCSLLETAASLKAGDAIKFMKKMKWNPSAASVSSQTLLFSSETRTTSESSTAAATTPFSRSSFQTEMERLDQDAAASERRAQMQQLLEMGKAAAVVEGEERDLSAYLNRLQDKLGSLKDERSQLEALKQQRESEFREAEIESDALQQSLEEMQKRYLQHQELLKYLEDPSGSIATLTDECSGVATALETQKQEFMTKKAKIEKKIETLQQSLLDETNKASGESESLTAEVDKLRRQIREKEKELSEARAATQKHGHETSEAITERANFIRRIMDMMKHIRKQQAEIDKHSANIRSALDEILSIENDRESTFRQVESVVYKEASRAEFPRHVYKKLVALREAFAAMVLCIEERGTVRLQQHAVEERTEKLSVRVKGLDMETVERDLKAVLSENEALQGNQTL